MPPAYLHVSCLALLILGICLESTTKIPQQGKDEVVIHLHAVTSVTLRKFDVDIYPSKRKIKLVYGLLDSLRRTALHQDTLYQRLDAAQHKKMEARQRIAIWQELVPVISKYEVYDKDSVTLKPSEDMAYVHLIERIVKAPDSLLQDPKDRLVLDGTQVSCDIITIKGKRTIQSHSLTATVNPLLYQLLTQSLDQYRKRKGNMFLTQQRTSGY